MTLALRLSILNINYLCNLNAYLLAFQYFRSNIHDSRKLEVTLDERKASCVSWRKMIMHGKPWGQCAYFSYITNIHKQDKCICSVRSQGSTLSISASTLLSRLCSCFDRNSAVTPHYLQESDVTNKYKNEHSTKYS